MTAAVFGALVPVQSVSSLPHSDKKRRGGIPKEALNSPDYSDVEHYFMLMAAKENLFVFQEKL